MKAALYCRLSEEDREKQHKTDDSGSIQNQKSMLLQYAAEQGWEVYDVYSDDDYAGADRKRPEFNRLLKDAKEHRFEIILCKTQSRFTRELELVEKYIHGLFPLWGIRFVSIVDNADTANKGNKKSRQINGLVNEWYLEDLSENIRSVLADRRKKGLHIGSFALYGYQKDPGRKGGLQIDEEAAAVVREVFTLFSQGYGKTAIARMLNDRNIPNPTEYKRQHGLHCKSPQTKNSTLWRYSSISSMLTNEMYIGNMVQGKYGSVSYKTKQNRPRPKSEWYRVEGTHEPIIDRKLWEKVQAMIAQRTKPFGSGMLGLFAGKARCAECGYTLRSTQTRKKHYLQCSTRRAGQNACQGAFISVDKLEQLVLEELYCLLERALDRERLEKAVKSGSTLPQQKEKLEQILAGYRRKAEEYTKGLRELYLDKVKGLLSERNYTEMAEVFSTERGRLESLIAENEKHLCELEERAAAGGQLIQPYLHPQHLTREMVEVLIDYILVGRRIPGTREVPVEIHWNF